MLHRLVWAATLLAWTSAAQAQDTPDEVVELLASTMDDQRPLGSPPLIVVYILMAALGVRIAMRTPGRDPHPPQEA